MNPVKRSLKVTIEILALLVFIGLFLAILQNFVPGGPGASQPAVQPTLTGASAYPPPERTTYPIPSTPYPAPSSPPLVVASPTPYGLYPSWTPYPTNTARPGPTSTPIPLVLPAKDAAGVIYYVAIDEKGEKALKALEVDDKGKVKTEAKKIAGQLPEGTYYPSPDGKRVAIVNGWGVGGILDQHNNKFEPFSRDLQGRIRFFNWFPDSWQILFRDDIGNLLLADPISGAFSPLFVPTFGTVRGAAASPDGRYVVYSYEAFIEGKGIWLIDSDGRNARLLSDGIGKNFSWSPDGSKIVFHGAGLEIMNADGSDRRGIYGDFILPLCNFVPPLWSPDSQTLAIVSASPDAFCQGTWGEAIFQPGTKIYLIDVATGNSHSLLDDGSGSLDPAWSPDGKKLIFVSNRSGQPNLWIVDANGTNPEQLTTDGQFVRFPAWRKP